MDVSRWQGDIVALLAEGVDRNITRITPIEFIVVALLAEGVDRNGADHCYPIHHYVALLAEGVDRNQLPLWLLVVRLRSPSSRRAWIEIVTHTATTTAQNGRPPRGGRG